MYIRICGTSDLADGEVTKYEINNRWILVARAGAVYFASDATCTHEEADLSLGLFANNAVACPLHHAKFDMQTGTVLEGPDGVDPNSISSLRIYKIKIELDNVLVDL